MAVTSLTIDEQARVLGNAVWLEQRCFEVVGGWVRSTADPDAKLTFAAVSHHHGAHAQALELLLPATRDHDPAALVAPLDDGWPGRIDEAAAATSTPDRVAAAQSLLDAVLASHHAALAQMTPVADRPAMRALALVIDDEQADRAAL